MNRPPAPHLRAAVAAAALVAVAALGAGCSGTGGGSGASGGTANEAGAPAAAPARGPAGGSAAGGSAAGGSAAGAKADGTGSGTVLPAGRPLPPAGTADRSIVYTAELSLQVDDVARSADRAVDIATAAGGYLFDRHGEAASRTEDVTLEVPAPRYTGVLASLGRLGKRTADSESASDVTDEVVDLTSRVSTARASVRRVRALLDRATDIGQVVDIEGELSSRQADLESLEGRLAVLSNQVALATIHVHLRAAPAHPAPVPPGGHRTGFLGGLSAGWSAFVAAATGTLTAVGAVLPFAVVLGAAAALALWLRRGRLGRKAHAEP